MSGRPRKTYASVTSATKIANELGVPELLVRKAAERTPAILSIHPKQLALRIAANASVLGIAVDKFTKRALKAKELLFAEPEDLRLRIEQLSIALGLTEEAVIKAVLRHPKLLKRRPRPLAANLCSKASALGMTTAEFLTLAVRQPALLMLKPEIMRRKLAAVEQIALATGRNITAKEIVRQLPAALCYSDERLRARHAFACMAGKQIGIGHLFTLPERELTYLESEIKNRTKSVV